MSAALPCPFCGVEPKVTDWLVRCVNISCGVFPCATGSTTGEALEFWNNRPIEAHLRERVERYKDDLQWLVDDVVTNAAAAGAIVNARKALDGEPRYSCPNCGQPKIEIEADTARCMTCLHIAPFSEFRAAPGDTVAQCGGE